MDHYNKLPSNLYLKSFYSVIFLAVFPYIILIMKYIGNSISTLFQEIGTFIQVQNFSFFNVISFVLFILTIITFAFKIINVSNNRSSFTSSDCVLFLFLLLLCMFLPFFGEAIFSGLSSDSPDGLTNRLNHIKFQ